LSYEGQASFGGQAILDTEEYGGRTTDDGGQVNVQHRTVNIELSKKTSDGYLMTDA